MVEVLGLWEMRGRGGDSLVDPLLRRQALVTPPHFLIPTPCVSEAPRFESIMEDVEVGAGETARFAVVVEGKPLPDIMWYKVRGRGSPQRSPSLGLAGCLGVWEGSSWP